MIASLWMLCSVMMFSCSNKKTGDAPQENQPTPVAPAETEAPASVADDNDPNAIPDEVVAAANSSNYDANGQTLTAKDLSLIIRYDDDRRHCAYYMRPDYMDEIYQYNLENKKVRVITLTGIDVPPARKGDKPEIMGVKQIVADGDRFYFVGSNNAYSMGGMAYMEYLISYNTFENNFRCIASGRGIELKNDNQQAEIMFDNGSKTINLP